MPGLDFQHLDVDFPDANRLIPLQAVTKICTILATAAVTRRIQLVLDATSEAILVPIPHAP